MAAERPTRRVTCRQFDTPIIETFSRVHPASPFIFWLPTLAVIGGYCVYAGLNPLAMAGLSLLGFLAWTLTEYVIHRYPFHFTGPRPWQRRFHFIFHGVHHDYPQDRMRLVMPLGVSIPLGVAFFLAMNAMLPMLVAAALFIGFGLGYLAYDGIHYFTHHGKAKRAIPKFLKKYHLIHHHAHVEGMWGVSSPLWDYVFGTSQDLNKPKAGKRKKARRLAEAKARAA